MTSVCRFAKEQKDLVHFLFEGSDSTHHCTGSSFNGKILRRVTGKQNLLFELADAALCKPDGIVRDVVFWIVKEDILKDLVGVALEFVKNRTLRTFAG